MTIIITLSMLLIYYELQRKDDRTVSAAALAGKAHQLVSLGIQNWFTKSRSTMYVCCRRKLVFVSLSVVLCI